MPFGLLNGFGKGITGGDTRDGEGCSMSTSNGAGSSGS